jgi:hypothetical protein
MRTIEKIKAKLEKYPHLKYKVEGDSLTIDPPTGSGFSVWFRVYNRGFTVGFDGWHEEFENEEEALNALAFGLSNQYRLKVIKRGNTDCKWVLEAKDGEEWKEDSITGRIFIPFWKKTSIEYRQNNIIGVS